MFKVGLTGGIAAGKTTVCQAFDKLGIDIFDADIIARELVEVGSPCYQEVVLAFGSNFLLADQTVNRAQLRQLIFSDIAAKKTLEDILHPAIHTELIARSHASQTAYCILVIPLLFESKLTYPLNKILSVEATEQQQLVHLCARDDLAIETARMIITQQATQADRYAIADDIIYNDAGLDRLENQAIALHRQYLQQAKTTTIVAS